MKFGSTPIPDSLFVRARNEMRSRASFTPEDIRSALVRDGALALQSVSTIPQNMRIIADRVMRQVLGELRDAGEVESLKRGVWRKTANLTAARREENAPSQN